MTSTRTERRQYTKEFKKEAVELLLNNDKTAVALSGELGIRVEILYRWKQEYLSQKENAFPGIGRQNLSPEELELKKLETENRELKEERDILKKPWLFSQRDLSEVRIYKKVQLRS